LSIIAEEILAFPLWKGMKFKAAESTPHREGRGEDTADLYEEDISAIESKTEMGLKKRTYSLMAKFTLQKEKRITSTVRISQCAGACWGPRNHHVKSVVEKICSGMSV